MVGMNPTLLLAHPAFTGVSRRQFACLTSELESGWLGARESERRMRRGAARQRNAGAGPRYKLPFEARVLVTLVSLRVGLSHTCLAVLFGVSRQTVDSAVNEFVPLLAQRGIGAPHNPMVRLRTLADVFAYAAHHDETLCFDGTEIQVRRPQPGAGRKRFVSGKKRQNTMKTTIVADDAGHVLHATQVRPGRIHDQTALKYDGVEQLFNAYPSVHVLVDAGYRGLARDYEQVSAPPKQPPHDALPAVVSVWREARKTHSTARIPVEHAIGSLKHWRVLQRWTGRREKLPHMVKAIAGLAADKRIDNRQPD